jgi:hypothetical protein
MNDLVYVSALSVPDCSSELDRIATNPDSMRHLQKNAASLR